MENNFENFTKYRAKLRYQHFNNNKYSTLKAFNSSTSAVEFWDINFFRNFFNMPCAPDHMRSSTFERFLNDEIANPTFDWPNMFNYLENLQKQQLVINKLHERLSRIRTDYNQKALQLILKRKPSFIVIEDLNIKGLMKNKHLSKAISQAQWYASRLFLQHQCEKLGIELRLAPRFYPSSKLCSQCGYKNKDLKLKDRHWECPNCHVIHNRDKNASINLEKCVDYTVLTTV